MRNVFEYIVSSNMRILRLWIDLFADALVCVASIVGMVWIVKNWNLKDRF